jgi:hypothetical protein
VPSFRISRVVKVTPTPSASKADTSMSKASNTSMKQGEQYRSKKGSLYKHERRLLLGAQ